MEEIIKRLCSFFTSTRISISYKIGIPLLVGFSLLLVDDVLGTSYYWMNEMEIEYIVKLETAKKNCRSDSVLVSLFNDKLDHAINRQNAFQKFTSLFKSAKIDSGKETNETNSDGNLFSKIEDMFPEAERNQMWHTITSSLIWILFAVLLSLYLVFVPFVIKKDIGSAMFGAIIGLVLFVLLIWITQWLFGLIPVLFNRAYINYFLQFIVNLFSIKLLVASRIKKKKEEKLA